MNDSDLDEGVDDVKARQPGTPSAAARRRPRSWLLAVAGGILITVVAGFEIGGVPSQVQAGLNDLRTAPLHTAASVALFPVTVATSTVPRIEGEIAAKAYHALRPAEATHSSGASHADRHDRSNGS